MDEWDECVPTKRIIMDIRVQHNQLPGTTAPQTSRPEETAPSHKTGPAPGPGVGGPAEDRVDISSLSENIAAASSAQEAQQAQRVTHLAALYGSGRYHVDALEVSRSLVSQALVTGPAKEGE